MYCSKGDLDPEQCNFVERKIASLSSKRETFCVCKSCKNMFNHANWGRKFEDLDSVNAHQCLQSLAVFIKHPLLRFLGLLRLSEINVQSEIDFPSGQSFRRAFFYADTLQVMFSAMFVLKIVSAFGETFVNSRFCLLFIDFKRFIHNLAK